MRLDVDFNIDDEVLFALSATPGAGSVKAFRLTAGFHQLAPATVVAFAGDGTVGPVAMEPGIYVVFAQSGATLSDATHLHVIDPAGSTLKQCQTLVWQTILSANLPGIGDRVYREPYPKDISRSYPAIWVFTEDANDRDTGDGTNLRTDRVYAVKVLIGVRGEIVEQAVADQCSYLREVLMRGFDWMHPANPSIHWTRSNGGNIFQNYRSVKSGTELIFTGSGFTVDCTLKQSRGF